MSPRKPGRTIEVRLPMLAWKYFFAHRKRYRFLLIAASLGFAVIVVMTALSAGMKNRIHQAAEWHYGGNLFIMGFFEGHRGNGRIIQHDLVENALVDADLDDYHSVIRTNLYRSVSAYAMGTRLSLKYVMGIDWENETGTAGAIDFSSPAFNETPGRDSIILSETVADGLEVETGDNIVLKTMQVSGIENAAEFTIFAIYPDTDAFGAYKVFIRRDRLNALAGYGEDDSSYFGISCGRGDLSLHHIQALRRAIAQRGGDAHIIESREAFHEKQSGQWKGIRYLIVPLEAFVSEIDDLVRAMTTISYAAFGIIVLIVISSVSVTYRLVLQERRSEMGTLRAIGMNSSTLCHLFLLESVYLSVLAIIVGMATAIFSLWLIRFLPLERIPGFGVFLTNGQLRGTLQADSQLFNSCILLVAISGTAWMSVRRVSRNPLMDCLYQDV